MRPAAVRLITAVLVAGGIGVAFIPVAQAASKLTPTTEGWYQANPTCDLPTGCLSVDTLPVPLPVEPPAVPVSAPLSPYPAGSMHVGWAAGKETARSYLAFPFESLTGTLTGALLDIPLDTNPVDGDTQSTTAKAQVCLATGPVVKVEASLNSPPAISCEQHAALTYVATPTPHMHADLAPLLLGLPTTSGIVLLPDATKNAESDAWRFVFSAHDRADTAKTPPATLTLAVDGEVISPPAEFPEADVPVVPDPVAVVDPGTGFVSSPSVPTIPDPVAPQVSQPQALPTAQTVTFGYAYPIVWLLPLVLLIMVPMATKALTKDLSPAFSPS
ncbi:MAG: hypothetical protein JWM40_1374 [Frankiales bacterium]|nr:hypothetical protein [Frankiales bacterium]